MLLLDAEALSAVAHGPAVRRDRVRALVAAMRARQVPDSWRGIYRTLGVDALEVARARGLSAEAVAAVMAAMTEDDASE